MLFERTESTSSTTTQSEQRQNNATNMPRAKSEAPMSAYDYDQERLRGECKSPEGADDQRRVAANMKALRLLDQTKVKSPEEAERNYNANMSALKLLDEVAGGDNFKPQPAVPPGMDLSPKQYTGQEDVEEDDIAAVDNFKRYKSSEAIAREKCANYKALKLIDAKFGGAANQKATRRSSPFASGASGGSKSAEIKEEAVDDNFRKYKSSETIAREKSANYKALKLIDAKFGGAANQKAKQKSSPFVPGASGGRTNVVAAAEAAEKQQATRPKIPHSDKPLEKMATTTRKKKQLTRDDGRDPESVSGMKCELDHNREKLAENKALKLANSSFAGETGIV
jgi:hypothetical protein